MSDKTQTRYCLGFLFSTTQDSVVLLRKNHPSWQAGKLNGIGGHVEEGETTRQAMIRETEEELGLTDIFWRRFAEVVGPDYRMDVFSATDDCFDRLGDTTDVGEQIEIHGWDPRDGFSLPQECIPNLRWLIPLALDPAAGMAVVKLP